MAADDGHHPRAEEYLRVALQSKKNSYAAHYGLGRVMIETGQIETALSHFKRALMLKPSPDLYYLVGRVYFEQGRIVSAERHWQRALALDPKYDAALYHLGLVYLRRNCVNKAREHFRAALELKPGNGRYRAAMRARANADLKPFPVIGLKRGRTEPGTGGLIEALLEDLNLKSPAHADEGETQR
jgi:tetratricopeptide (TPR) repeat protein